VGGGLVLNSAFAAKKTALVNRAERRKSVVQRDLSRIFQEKVIEKGGFDRDSGPVRILLDVRGRGDELEVDVDLSKLPGKPDVLRMVATEKSPRGVVLGIYAFVKASLPRGSRATLQARKTDEILVKPGKLSSAVSKELAGLEAGAFALVSADLKGIFDIFFPPKFVWTSVPVRVLQDASGTRALVFPVNGAGGIAPQAPGQYRLKLALDRRRWQTSDPPSDLNRYQRSSTISISWD
jgi:hypothetical protein